MKQLVGAIVGPDRSAADGAACRTPPRARVDPVARARWLMSPTTGSRVDLALRGGEIHGLAGLIGSGRTEILETIFGLRPVESRRARIDGRRVAEGASGGGDRQGIALVPEDRHVQGLVLEHSIERNLTLPRFRISPAGAGCSARRQASGNGDAPACGQGARRSTLVKKLSGGNQQKVVFGKWNDPRPRVLLLDEPTVGVDVGAREEIYGVIRSGGDGSGVLLVSSDLSELLQLCDRIS